MSLTETIKIGAVPEGLGAQRPVELPATRYLQGGRTMYHAVVTLAALPQLVQKRPDPNKPLEGNRKVDAGRAKKFATYLIANKDWVSPALIVRAPSGDISFEPLQQFPDGTAWGVLRIPLAVMTEILLLDGQHRTLGTFLALDDVNARITKLHDLVAQADRLGDIDARNEHERELKKAIAVRERLAGEHLSIDIAVVTSDQAHQMFADINNNAKGVNPDYTTFLDQRDVVNRISVKLIEDHQLLFDRVEIGQATRMTPANPNLLGAKAVADIVRSVHVGAAGRIGRRVEDELTKSEQAAYQRVRSFLDLLVAAFEELRAVMAGQLEPAELRKGSLLGSATMLRVLAAVFHDLTTVRDKGMGPDPMSRSEVEDFFRKLQPYLHEIPVSDGSVWMRSGAFAPNGNAPLATQGAIKQLVDFLVTWARTGRVPSDEPAVVAIAR